MWRWGWSACGQDGQREVGLAGELPEWTEGEDRRGGVDER